jgi:biotin synthase
MHAHAQQTARPLPEALRHDWTRAEALAIYEAPFNDLLFRAHSVHRRHFDPNRVQLSRLLSIKTGGCPEDCGYCSQSAHHATGLKASKLMEVERVVAEARKAKAAGATRYCMGAAWREPKARDMDAITAMGEVIHTRTFADRLATLARVREAGIKVCAGGIVGLGEEPADRVDMLVTLANLPEHPESVPINMLIAIPGTPLADAPPLDPIAFVRTIALARILMPRSYVRLSAGRTAMSAETQALCFFAGANSIFVGDTLLTADNPGEDADHALFDRLGLEPLEIDTGAAGTAPEARDVRGA